MTTTFRHIGNIAMIAAALLLAGCDTMDSAQKTAPADATPSVAAPAPPVTPEPPPPPAALTDGISLYNSGNYNGAIKRLANAQEIWSADTAFQTEALKYMAFSYCVTSRRKLCRLQFEKALKLDPAFDLAPGEKGHPLWGPVFNQVKKAVAAKAKKPA